MDTHVSLDNSETGEKGETVTVCRRNVPVAEIRPLPQVLEKKRPVGIDRGMEVPASFFDPRHTTRCCRPITGTHSIGVSYLRRS